MCHWIFLKNNYLSFQNQKQTELIAWWAIKDDTLSISYVVDGFDFEIDFIGDNDKLIFILKHRGVKQKNSLPLAQHIENGEIIMKEIPNLESYLKRRIRSLIEECALRQLQTSSDNNKKMLS